jgi:hypothetical protein
LERKALEFSQTFWAFHLLSCVGVWCLLESVELGVGRVFIL